MRIGQSLPVRHARPAIFCRSVLLATGALACAAARDVGPVAPPSCGEDAPATLACGAAGQTCCASLPIPGGSFNRTYGDDGTGSSAQADPASVSGYRLDAYLVTVGRFRRFVAASVAGWRPAAGAGKHVHLNGGRGLVDSGGSGFEPGWADADSLRLAGTAADWSARLACDPSFQTWTDAAGPNERLPLNCVDWFDAYAFCIWDGGFLPAEAEWEYAAAGGAQQRAYPWGSADPGSSSLYVISDCNYPPGSIGCAGAGNVAPVGTAALGAGRWGQLDLAGELAEWTLDWFAPYANPCHDCAALADFSYRVLRGGSFGTDTDNIRPAARDGDVPGTRNAFDGFRCARPPP